jgi:serine/threonine protein kinase/formylglycine-generating enzyme required for sulfatase activity
LDKTQHLALARLALSRNIVTLGSYSQVVVRLMSGGESPPLEDLWRGIISDVQLEELKKAASIGSTETMSPFGNSPMTEGAYRIQGTPVHPSVIHEHEGVVTEVTSNEKFPPRPKTQTGNMDFPDGRYRLMDEIGRGGMGTVQLAFDQAMEREVALKTLRPERQADPAAQRVFWAEAKVTGQLEHPQIVPVHDMGILPSGQLYYSMKRVRGIDLSKIIISLIRQNDPNLAKKYTLYRMLSLFVQACQGIAYAHAQGVLHRDLKPANLMFGDFGEVLVLDWGLAIRYTNLSEVERRRQLGRAVGTPGYMSPEQAKGEIDKMGPASDVFSLGAVLYEILTLTPVVQMDDPKTVIRRLTREPIEPPRKRSPERQIPGALEALCLWALEKRVEDRPRSASEFAEELQSFLEGAKERARRREEASSRETQGKELSQRYHELQERAGRLRTEASLLSLSIDPLASPQEKQSLWQKEDMAKQIEAEEGQVFGEAVRMLSQALSHDPEHKPTRIALAELYLSRLSSIEARGGSEEEVRLLRQLASTYDDGRFAAQLSGDGSLTLSCNPGTAQASLYRYEEENRVLRPKPLEEMGQVPISAKTLPMGSYAVVLRNRGMAPAAIPFHVGRCEQVDIAIRLHRTDRVVPGFAYIPGGLFFAQSTQTPGELQDFCIQVLPVTFGEYEIMLTELQSDAPRYVPRLGNTVLCSRGTNGRYFADPELIRAAALCDLPKGPVSSLPVFGVSFEDASMFAEWRSSKDGIRYRLPSALEWEKSARGADDRIYPWGNYFDLSFCKHRYSRHNAFSPEPVGSFPTDESPYGVKDCAGGVSEWVMDGPSRDWRYVRGGAWDEGTDACRVSYRNSFPMDGRFRGIGFRLAYSL